MVGKSETNGGIARAAAYCRAEETVKDKDADLKKQAQRCRDRILSNPDWELVKGYNDHDWEKKKQPSSLFLQMLADAKAHEFDILLVRSITVLGSNLIMSQDTLRNLKASGVVTICDKEGIDGTEPNEELLLNLMSAFAREEAGSCPNEARISL